MSRLKYVIPVLFLATTLVVAVVQGTVSGRWVPLPPIDGYVEALDAVPAQVGDWEATELPIDDPDSLKRGGIDGFKSRRYRHRRTGDEVSVLLVCGRAGPISVHTPDVCYRGAGFTAVGEATRTDYKLGDRNQTLWNLRFHPPASRQGESDLEIRWGWVADKGLEAPVNPRFSYSGQPALYKLYAIQERRTVSPAAPAKPTDAKGAAAIGDPALEFLTAFVPALESVLRSPPSP